VIVVLVESEIEIGERAGTGSTFPTCELVMVEICCSRYFTSQVGKADPVPAGSLASNQDEVFLQLK